MSSAAYVVENVIRGQRQFATRSDGTQWTRKINLQTGAVGDWSQVEAQPLAPPEPQQLHVVALHQADGEPKHWSLYAARADADGTTRGQVWQVTGDAECMHYEHAGNVDLFGSETFYWQQTVNPDLCDSAFATVDGIARREPPPQARSRREVTENCQGWTMRVLGRLVAEGVVRADAIAGLQQAMDPVN